MVNCLLTAGRIFDERLLWSKNGRVTNGSIFQNYEKQTDFDHFHGSLFELGGIGLSTRIR